MSTAAKVTAYALVAYVVGCIAVLCASAGIAGYLTAFIERDGLGITYLALTVGVVALVVTLVTAAVAAAAAVAYTYTAITGKK
jgi:hypothetical protein